jgi:LPXTG-motif cell wall-anchored protein
VGSRRVADWIRIAATVVAWTAAVAPAAQGQGPVRPRLIAADGFGDARNSYAWSMAWFKGQLYVGTARSAMCVEAATIAFYFPAAGYYRRQLAPGVPCPPTIHDADLRAEIWRYDPRTERWARVYRSPREIPNPRAPGRFVARDIGYRGMVVMKERGGRKAPAPPPTGVTVRRAQAARAAELPFTGANMIPPLLAGSILLAGGLLLRRRTRRY